ncbi:MAG: hypothetical protein ACXIUM_12755 [Wenzhouxiangella sp.]
MKPEANFEQTRAAFRLLPGLLLTLTLIAPLAATAWAETGPLIALERTQQPVAHPAEISASELSRALASLGYGERGLLGRSRSQAIFDAEELSALVPLLRDALGRAQPNQQVRFASFSRRSGALSQLFRTEGVLFVDAEQRLNLVFAGIHEFAGPDEDFFAFLALSNRDPMSLQRSLVRLELGAGDWTEHDDAALWVRRRLGAEPEPAAQAAVAAPTPAVPAASEPAAVSSAPAAGSSLETQVRQRLEFLRGLYEDGLISEEEYAQQRREALQRLD